MAVAAAEAGTDSFFYSTEMTDEEVMDRIYRIALRRTWPGPWKTTTKKEQCMLFDQWQERAGLIKIIDPGSGAIHSMTIAGNHQVHRKRQAQAQLAARKWHDSGLVFTNRNGGGLSPSGYIYDEWKKICAAAGVSYLTPHGLRHTHATWLLEAGVPLHVVAERLGHKDAMVTATIYAQVTGKQSRAASDVFASIMSV